MERADGSAKWVQDGTAVLAAVHGPTQAGARKEDAERAIIQVLFKPRNGIPGGARGGGWVLFWFVGERQQQQQGA